MRFLGTLFAPRLEGPADTAYHKAVSVSDDLMDKIKNSIGTGSVNRELLATLVDNQHNIPFLTSVYETVQEMDMPKVYGLRRH